MKKIYFFGFMLLASLAFVSLSCKSAPKPAEEKPPAAKPAGGPSQSSLDALSAALARAQEARKRAGDFDGPSYFPSDWEDAEAQFNSAGSLPKNSDADVSNAVAAYNTLADTYDGIFNRTIPLYAQAREDEIMALRTGVIDTGLTSSFPGFLPPADKTALRALDQYEAKDYYAAKDSAEQAQYMYQILKDGADAWLLGQEITGREFDGYDPDNFDRAGELLSHAADQYNAGSYTAAHESAAEALHRYQMILAEAWTAYATQRADLADGERQAAIDVKANIAVKDTFNEADDYFKQGAAAMRDKHYEDAARVYTQAEALFMMSSLSAAEKRRQAAESIREAETKIEESDEAARQAEIIIGGGSE